ncbi:probable calcium-binding protein CML26 [Cornus florida]|uniref:probable calcium-binding protein CML26 n=1 Tax=Cornus florida TaxID=4283 RepID=UPI00289D4E10|nr:probable calcium-binding protein CML26 [Cornus florida]
MFIWRIRIVSVPLSEEQIKGLLKRYDTNRDGKLSREELKSAFKSLGLHFSGCRARRALRHADANEDGFVSEEELNELVRLPQWTSYGCTIPHRLSKEKAKCLYAEPIKGLLKRYDTNQDGKLSREELKVAFKSLGLRFSGRRARRALCHADANADGSISEEEMNELVNITKQATASIMSRIFVPHLGDEVSYGQQRRRNQ